MFYTQNELNNPERGNLLKVPLKLQRYVHQMGHNQLLKDHTILKCLDFEFMSEYEERPLFVELQEDATKRAKFARDNFQEDTEFTMNWNIDKYLQIEYCFDSEYDSHLRNNILSLLRGSSNNDTDLIQQTFKLIEE